MSIHMKSSSMSVGGEFTTTNHRRCGKQLTTLVYAKSGRSTRPNHTIHNENRNKEVMKKRSELLKESMLVAVASLVLPPVHPARAVPIGGGHEGTLAAATAQAAQSSISDVFLSTLSDCELAVSIYPTFSYDASGGGGIGTVTRVDGNTAHVVFDPTGLRIPPINYATSKILAVPIPPPLEIRITPKKLEGDINMQTGDASLDFLAEFSFSAGTLYKAHPLTVETTLTTDTSTGVLRKGKGTRMDASGKAKLAGVARVPKTGDAFLDNFLILPTDALAVLSADLKFT